jgi:hypothetical protein
MAIDSLVKVGKKLNNRKSGAAAANKLRKRTEAEARNAEYQKLSFDHKMQRNSSRVRTALLIKQAAAK